ncbi:uncharacterized protein LOC126566167 [Anopheles maculipalpis]|uniref:uncharacterized protein LOC126566167 n=1 Tax=Anopheles maculipalpis TaxID=1496333 RepID=UPI002159A031|nr:uncharacterized protein LOC126566167 [Anopheles maculipalpis]
MWRYRARYSFLLIVLSSSLLIWRLIGTSFAMERQERAALVFPRGSSMGYLLAIAIPLLVPGRNIYLSHNFEANYGVPSNETQYFLWYQRFKDTKFNITKAIETNRRRRRELLHGFSRSYFYDQLEQRMYLYGFNGTGCMERLICEMSELPLGEHNGVFGDVLSVIFRPSASVREESLPDAYYKAESSGTIEGCERYRAYCKTDLLGFVSTVL